MRTESQQTLFELTRKQKIGQLARQANNSLGKVPEKAHRLIADTFVGKGVKATGIKAAAGYGGAAASGGLSAWLTHKFLPESIQGAMRKIAVGGAGVGGSFLPSLVRKLIVR